MNLARARFPNPLQLSQLGATSQLCVAVSSQQAPRSAHEYERACELELGGGGDISSSSRRHSSAVNKLLVYLLQLSYSYRSCVLFSL